MLKLKKNIAKSLYLYLINYTTYDKNKIRIAIRQAIKQTKKNYFTEQDVFDFTHLVKSLI